MGILISPSHSVLKPDNKIKITNFRAIKYVENEGVFFNKDYETVENVTGLLVITREAREYFFEGMTIQDFFKILNSSKNTKWKGRYKREALVCGQCGGCGKSDWVRNITNVSKPYNINDRCGFVKMNYSYKFCLETNYHLSQAMLKKHEEHCKTCAGTGLYFVNPENLVNSELE